MGVSHREAVVAHRTAPQHRAPPNCIHGSHKNGAALAAASTHDTNQTADGAQADGAQADGLEFREKVPRVTVDRREMRSPLPFPRVSLMHRPSKRILLVQVGTLSSSHPPSLIWGVCFLPLFVSETETGHQAPPSLLSLSEGCLKARRGYGKSEKT